MAKVSLLWSNMNNNPIDIGRRGWEFHRDLLDRMGVHDGGMEVTPTNALMLDLARLTLSGSFHNVVDDKTLVGATHQTWGHGIPQAARGLAARNLLEIGAGGALVEQRRSLRSMRRIDNVLGQKLGSVVFDDHLRDPNFSFHQTGLDTTKMGIQLEPHTAKRMGILGYKGTGLGQKLRQNLDNLGIGGLVVDAKHLVDGHPGNPDLRLNPGRILAAAQVANVPILRLHARAGSESEAYASDEDLNRTGKDARGLLRGQIGETSLGGIFADSYAIFCEQNKGDDTAVLPITIEMPQDILGEAHRDGWLPAEADMVGMHQQIGHNILDYMAGLGATVPVGR